MFQIDYVMTGNLTDAQKILVLKAQSAIQSRKLINYESIMNRIQELCGDSSKPENAIPRIKALVIGRRGRVQHQVKCSDCGRMTVQVKRKDR